MDSLTPKEKDILNEFRGRVADKVPPHLSSDFELSKWLIARNFNINKAEAMLLKSLEWRKEWGIDNIIEWSPPEVLKKFFPGGISGYDKEGAPVVLIPYGNIDLRGLIRSSSNEELIKYFTQLFEKSLKLLREQSRDRDQPIGKEIFIVDFEHFSLRDFSWRPALNVCFKFVKMYEENYPEILKCLFLVNAPKSLSVAFNMTKHLINANTLKRFKFYGKNGWKEDILKEIDSDQLPVHWGGTMTDPDGNVKCPSKKYPFHVTMLYVYTRICLGGKVPKEYYLKNKLLRNQNQNLHLDFKNHKTLGQNESEIFEYEACDNTGMQLRWEFRSTGSDIAYEVSRIISEEVEELIPLQRVNSQVFKEEGTLTCDEKGLCEYLKFYKIRFMNDLDCRKCKIPILIFKYFHKIIFKNAYSDRSVELYYNIELKESEKEVQI
ncbi:SEC14-like protein 2 [Armadillidium nasatum]|uniref:SEC14-like protein 2 n=1 Tax=Armadillidium nasatum TaxID=96803 RepID=A0A5N5T4I4_9CRUS|nr:SEC14-like protein 2 [Armadillidium nasatum]